MNFTSCTVCSCRPLLWQQTLKEMPAEGIYREVLTAAEVLQQIDNWFAESQGGN